jgi:cell division protein FtsZ
MGVGEDLELGNNISVTIIATGFGDEKQKSLVSSESKKIIYNLDQDHPFEQTLIDDDKELLDNLNHQSDSIVDEKVNDESQQKKIESEINEILRNIDITFEVIEPEINKININEIEVNGIEYISPELNDFSENNDSKNEISFDLFSSHNDINNNNVEQEIIESNIEFENHNNFEKEHVTDFTNAEEDNIEFIKLDLNDEVSEDYEINEKIQVNEDNLDIETEEAINLFEKPIDTDLDNENLIRKENLKQYNYVFKNKNSTIEDLEKIPAYKRMGIEINNQKTQNEDILSKTILNEDNQLEFPDVNTYIHDNVD